MARDEEENGLWAQTELIRCQKHALRYLLEFGVSDSEDRTCLERHSHIGRSPEALKPIFTECEISPPA